MQISQKRLFRKIVFSFTEQGVHIQDTNLKTSIEIYVDYENIDRNPSRETNRPIFFMIFTLFSLMCTFWTGIGYAKGYDFGKTAWIFWGSTAAIMFTLSLIRMVNIITYSNSDNSRFIVLNNPSNQQKALNIGMLISQNRKLKLKGLYGEKYLTETIENYKDRIRILVNDEVLNKDEAQALLKKHGAF
jgi:hypothetical protein